METKHLFEALAFFCLAAACFVVYFRRGKWLKKAKRDIEAMEKRLNELKPPNSLGSEQKHKRGV